jgi:hypothetical protein|tara:strand:- start:2785 stop:3000 length:216 start_codon:yes stop_codon:yes gene_type:complete
MSKDKRQDCFIYMKNKNLFFKDMEIMKNIWDYSDSVRLTYFRKKKGIRYETGFELTKDGKWVQKKKTEDFI